MPPPRWFKTLRTVFLLSIVLDVIALVVGGIICFLLSTSYTIHPKHENIKSSTYTIPICMLNSSPNSTHF